MSFYLCGNLTLNFQFPFFKRKKKEDPIVINDYIMVECPESEEYEYRPITSLNDIVNSISDIQIYSKQLNIIFIDGVLKNKLKLVNVNGKNIKNVLPIQHQVILRNNIELMKEKREHFQKIYSYGMNVLVHDYFALIEKSNVFIGIILIVRTFDY